MEESQHPVVVQPVHQNPLHAPSVVAEPSSAPPASTQRVSRARLVPQAALTVLPASPLHASAARPLLQYDRDDAQGLEDGRFIGYFSETSFTYRAAGASAPGALSWTPFSLATINDAYDRIRKSRKMG